jgi:hypothetical protein
MRDFKIPSRSLKLAIGVAVLTAASNLIWFLYYWGGLLQAKRNSIAQGGDGWLIDWSVVGMHLRIEVVLIIAALGLLSRKVSGLIISLIALIWIGIEYLNWYIWTQRTIEAADIIEIPRVIPGAGNLYGATGWNIAVLAIVSALFVWEAKTLIGILRSSHENGYAMSKGLK